MWKICSAWLLLLCQFLKIEVFSTPVSSPSWDKLISSNGIKFTGRNGKIWVTGGRTASYTMYNLLTSFKRADVWYSDDGALWAQESNMIGDFFAQNSDVVQPGEIAPWYERYGHSLNAVDIDGDGYEDIMVLAGGFASYPSNDIWITEEGRNWTYAGLAPWSPRGWHSTTVFKNQLWLMGGTPLNNEVWVLRNVSKVLRSHPPLTRALYNDYTFDLKWEFMGKAPWSPRVGAGLVSQYFFDTKKGETVEQSRERLVLVGGYGGFPDTDENKYDGSNSNAYDGFYCRSDAWESYDGVNWQLINSSLSIGGRAWFGMVVQRGSDPRLNSRQAGDTLIPPKLYIFGGGKIGFKAGESKRITSMVGYADAYWSIDGNTWNMINYQEGGGSSTIPFYSSQEWSRTIVDSNTVYIGLWGLTVHSFNFSTKAEYPGDFILIGGDHTGAGDFSSSTYRSLSGLTCDTRGIICSNRGTCTTDGCVCEVGYSGEQCEISTGENVSAAYRKNTLTALIVMIVGVSAILNYFML